MPGTKQNQPDQRRIVASSASECRLPIGEESARYEDERAEFASGARITNVLYIFATRKVLAGLHQRDLGKVSEHGVAASTARVGDAVFVTALVTWIRFSAAEAQRAGDGLFPATTGARVIPRWLASPLMGPFLAPRSENERHARQVRNSPGIAVFVSEVNDKAHWVEVARCHERFALRATAIGLDRQPPDPVVRFGRGPAMPLSMRRPVEAVVVQTRRTMSESRS